MRFREAPQTVLVASGSLLSLGVLGLIPALMTLSTLLTNFANYNPDPQIWRWQAPPSQVLWTLRLIITCYCVIWAGWVISAVAIYFGRRWGWICAASLTAGIFIVWIKIAFSYTSMWQSSIFACGFFGLSACLLTRPSLLKHCGVSESNRSGTITWSTIGAALCVGLFVVGEELFRRLI